MHWKWYPTKPDKKKAKLGYTKPKHPSRRAFSGSWLIRKPSVQPNKCEKQILHAHSSKFFRMARWFRWQLTYRNHFNLHVAVHTIGWEHEEIQQQQRTSPSDDTCETRSRQVFLQGHFWNTGVFSPCPVIHLLLLYIPGVVHFQHSMHTPSDSHARTQVFLKHAQLYLMHSHTHQSLFANLLNDPNSSNHWFNESENRWLLNHCFVTEADWAMGFRASRFIVMFCMHPTAYLWSSKLEMASQHYTCIMTVKTGGFRYVRHKFITCYPNAVLSSAYESHI